MTSPKYSRTGDSEEMVAPNKGIGSTLHGFKVR